MKQLIAVLAGVLWSSLQTASAAPPIQHLDASLAPRATRAAPARPARLTAADAGFSGHRFAASDAPSFVWAPGPERAGRFEQGSALEAARAQLDPIAALYGGESAAALGLAVTSIGQDGLGLRVATLEQRVDGVPVFRGQLRALLDRRNDLVAVSGLVVPLHAQGRAVRSRLPGKGPAEAVAVAYSDVAGIALASSMLSASGRADAGGYHRLGPAAYARPLDPGFALPARARQVLFPVDGALVPAWYTEVSVAGSEGQDARAVAHVIAAADGALLFRQDLTSDASFGYRVWAQASAPFAPLDGPHGTGGTPYPGSGPGDWRLTPGPSNLVQLHSAPFSRNDPWLSAGATTTSGNNVFAFADLAAPDGLGAGDLTPSITSPGTFDHAWDPQRHPADDVGQIAAGVVQLFFVNNWLHDWFYDAGFSEADGNAQASNYGRGGLEGDPIIAQGMDFSRTNNATMSTPADGASPVMSMFLFDGPTERTLTITAPASVAGDYETGIAAAFGPQSFDVSAALGRPLSASGREACSPLDGTDAAAVVGKLAMLVRGSCDFTVKVLNAQGAGALGVIVVNNVPGVAPGLGGTSSSVSIPVLSVSQSDGSALFAALGAGPVQGRMIRLATVPIDSSMDTSIVAHEWGHYLSNRLIGNSAGLGNHQGRSMGEGWGDFVGLLVTARAEDAQLATNAGWNGAFPVGAWATRGIGANAEYFGIRRVPYSSDMDARNALTFGHVIDGTPLPTHHPIRANGLPNSALHNAGEVWATALWDCYAGLLRDVPRLDFEEAQSRMKSYLVTSLKLTPPTPTFTEARDAVLAAIRAHDRADFEICAQAFARRGLGVFAVSADRSSTTNAGAVENFDNTSRIEWVSATVEEAREGSCDRDGQVDGGEQGILTVTLRNTGWTATREATAAVTAPSAMTLVGPTSVTLPLIEAGASATVQFPFRLGELEASDVLVSLQVTYRDAASADATDRTATVHFRANRDERAAAAFAETVESKAVEAGEGGWSYAHDPGGLAVDFEVVEQADGNRLFFAPAMGGLSDLALVSPPIRVADGPFSVGFKHLYDFESSPGTYWDGGVVELSTDDGATWTEVPGSAFTSPGGYRGVLSIEAENPLGGRRAFSGTSGGWPTTFDAERMEFGTAYAGQTVRLRFRVGTDLAVGAGGWFIDDIEVEGALLPPFTGTLAEDGVCQIRPSADAGPDQVVSEGSAVTLVGHAVVTPGASPRFTWTQRSGTPVTLEPAGDGKAHFTAPQVEAGAETLVFELVVGDGELESEPDAVTVRVEHVASAEPEPEPEPEEAAGCGCTSATAGAALPLLLLMGGLLRRRRR